MIIFNKTSVIEFLSKLLNINQNITFFLIALSYILLFLWTINIHARVHLILSCRFYDCFDVACSRLWTLKRMCDFCGGRHDLVRVCDRRCSCFQFGIFRERVSFVVGVFHEGFVLILPVLSQILIIFQYVFHSLFSLIFAILSVSQCRYYAFFTQQGSSSVYLSSLPKIW